MKKLIVLCLSIAFAFALAGCSDVGTEESPLLREGSVKSISVTSLPEIYDYSFVGKDTEAIVDYLSGLNLIEQFEENPDEYAGMSWLISLKYDDGEFLQIYHFGNMFIRTEDGPWYKMTYEEASRFGTLLTELDK